MDGPLRFEQDVVTKIRQRFDFGNGRGQQAWIDFVLKRQLLLAVPPPPPPPPPGRVVVGCRRDLRVPSSIGGTGFISTVLLQPRGGTGTFGREYQAAVIGTNDRRTVGSQIVGATLPLRKDF